MPDTSDERARALVVVEFHLLRHGIVTLMDAIPWLRICAETSEPARARQLCSEQKPDLIVLDLDFRTGDGLGLLSEFGSLHPEAASLVLSEREDVSWLQRCFQTGARGYISKRDGTTELGAGLWRLIQGDRYVSHHMTHVVLQQATSGRRSPAESGVEALSNRELAVLRLIGQGQGASAIARGLGINVKTIETHFQRIKTKLGLRSGEELKRHAADWVLSKS